MIGIHLGTRVRLAAKARLRFDPPSGKQILLYPERGLELSDSAARIVALCSQPRIVAAIVDELAASVTGASRERIETEVLAFLGTLADRGLLLVLDGEARA
jgi:coenzyme PQQ biosynthesis protein PqqD